MTLASGMPASPGGSEEAPGQWPWFMGRANVDLIFGSLCRERRVLMTQMVVIRFVRSCVCRL